MKKKLVFLLLIMVVCVVAFAGCSNERFYQRNVSSFEDLAKAMGDKMVYPTFELKATKEDGSALGFFNEKDFKDAVSIPPEARYNEIILLYIPPLTAEEGKALTDKEEITFDEKAYRYSVKMTLNKAADYGEVFNNGVIELYIHGTDYSKVKDVDPALKGKVEFIPIEGEKDGKPFGRKNKLEADNKGDQSKLEKNGEADYFVSKVEKVNDKDVYFYENKLDGQVIRYFTVGEDYGYELTACIRVDGKIKDDAAKKTAYDALLNEAKSLLDGFVNDMTK